MKQKFGAATEADTRPKPALTRADYRYRLIFLSVHGNRASPLCKAVWVQRY
jgi:hypothetical protein